MKMITNNRLKIVSKALSSLIVLLALSVGSVQAEESPEEVVKRTVDTIVDNIQTNRSQYQEDPDMLYTMVHESLIPAVHVDRMSGLILGNSAKTATAEQKKEFAEEFEKFLIRSYGTAILDFTGDESVIYQPVVMEPGADKVTIHAELVASDGKQYPISLYMSNRGDTSWRAYNMEVDGINVVSTYRANFGGLIAQKGIDGLIADLKEKNAKLAS